MEKKKDVYRIYRSNLGYFRYVIKVQSPGCPEWYLDSASTKWGARRIIRRFKNLAEDESTLVEER